MNEILKERLKNSVGKRVLIFLHNGFRYEGKITNCDDKWIEILNKFDKYDLIEFGNIESGEVDK